MTLFTPEEINLICIYDPGNRAGTIYELRSMMDYLMPDKTDLKALAEGVISKLEKMTDDEYDAFSDELSMEAFPDIMDEDSGYGFLWPLWDDIDPDAEIE